MNGSSQQLGSAMKITFQQLPARLVAFLRRHCPTVLVLCIIISMNSIPSALFALGSDGGGNCGGSLTNSPPGGGINLPSAGTSVIVLFSDDFDTNSSSQWVINSV